jgi:SAM-dependent methyltransferase
LSFQTCRVVRCTACRQLKTSPEPTVSAQLYSQRSSKYALAGLADPLRAGLWRGISSGIVSKLEQFSPEKGRLLDVGCNLGDLLMVARERGWSPEGLEINSENACYLEQRGFTMHRTYLEQAAIEDNRFDAVVINHVLEHVPEPNEFLRSVRRVLRPGGLLFVGVPCFWSPIPLLFKRDTWYALVPDEHVWQFSTGSLKGLLRSHRFSTIWLNRGCSAFWGRLTLKPKEVVRWIVYRSVALLGQGDFVNVIARNVK